MSDYTIKSKSDYNCKDTDNKLDVSNALSCPLAPEAKCTFINVTDAKKNAFNAANAAGTVKVQSIIKKDLICAKEVNDAVLVHGSKPKMVTAYEYTVQTGSNTKKYLLNTKNCGTKMNIDKLVKGSGSSAVIDLTFFDNSKSSNPSFLDITDYATDTLYTRGFIDTAHEDNGSYFTSMCS